MGLVIDIIWDFLGRNLCLLFGTECACSAMWMMVALLLRAVLIICRLSWIIPYGVIFALPLSIQLMSDSVPILKTTYPLLPVRFAESLIGRMSTMRLTIVVPAHFIGCIFSVVLFKSLCPLHSLADSTLSPIHHEPSHWLVGLTVECFMVAAHILVVLVLPDILEVNMLNKLALSLPLLPLMVLTGASCNPTAIYALWFVHGTESPQGFQGFQPERLAGAVLGSLVAGTVCAQYFPDDSSSWRRKPQLSVK